MSENPHEDLARLRKAVRLINGLELVSTRAREVREHPCTAPPAEDLFRFADALTSAGWQWLAYVAEVPEPSTATKRVVLELLNERRHMIEEALLPPDLIELVGSWGLTPGGEAYSP